MSPMSSARRRSLQRFLLALAGLLVLALVGVLGSSHGSTTVLVGALAAGIAACLLAAGLLPSDTPRLRPPPNRPGGGYGSTAGLSARYPGYWGAGGLGVDPSSDPRVSEVAEAEGWTYRRHDRNRTESLLRPPMDPRAEAYDVVSGKVDGVEFTAFSYGVRLGPGRPPVYRVVAVRLPGELPPIAVGPERLIRPVSGILGLPNVEIESEAFNRSFKVLARDRRLAVALLTPRTVEQMLTTEPFAWRIERDLLLSWDESLVEPESLPGRIRQVTAIVRHAPAFLWNL